MKKLTCELCGSLDIVKQDGFFVCQSCGCKYTIKEAKNLMAEGKVKVDNSERLENLYVLARRAKKDNNFDEAAKYYGEIKIEDPNSWEAAYYSVYYNAMNCTIAGIAPAANSVTNCMESVSKLINDYVPEEKKEAAYKEFLLSAVLLGNTLFTGTVNAYQNSSYPGKYHDFQERAAASILVMCSAGLLADTIFHDVLLSKDIYEGCIETCNSFNLANIYTRVPENALKSLEPRVTEVRKKRHDDYWEAHAIEKAKLLKEKDRLISERDELRTQISILNSRKKKVPAISEYDECKNNAVALMQQINALGFFKKKEKKALEEQYEVAKRLELQSMQMVELQKAKIDEEMKPITNHIKEINARIGEIDSELNKDR